MDLWPTRGHENQIRRPRKAGTHSGWIPAFAGMTNLSDFQEGRRRRGISHCSENRGAGVSPAVARASCPRHVRPLMAHFHGFWVPVSRRA